MGAEGSTAPRCMKPVCRTKLNTFLTLKWCGASGIGAKPSSKETAVVSPVHRNGANRGTQAAYREEYRAEIGYVGKMSKFDDRRSCGLPAGDYQWRRGLRICEQHWRKDLDEDVVQVLICPQIVLKIGADLLEFRTAINAAIVSGRECGPGHKLGID